MKTLILTIITFLISNIKVLAQEEIIDSLKYDFFDVTKTINGKSETISMKIKRNTSIFLDGRKYCYQADLIDSSKKIIYRSQVDFIGTSKRWDSAPTSQMGMWIKFKRNENDSILYDKYNDNQKYSFWCDSILTGIIENSQRIWIHPIRYNQFLRGEIAPFPEIRLPIEQNKKWDNTLSIYSGWGDYESTITNQYEIIEKVNLILKDQSIECWKISATNNYYKGKNETTVLYNEKYGFVKMHYVFYDGIEYDFNLIDAQ